MILGPSHELADIGPVDLEDVHRDVGRITERGAPRPEVVDRKANAKLAYLTHAAQGVGDVPRQRLFRDLQYEAGRVDPRVVDRASDVGHEGRREQLPRRDIHRQRERATRAELGLPARQLGARLLQHPLA